MLMTLDEDRFQRGEDVGAVADIDDPERLQCVDHSTRADRNAGGAQRAGKADDVIGDKAGGGRGHARFYPIVIPGRANRTRVYPSSANINVQVGNSRLGWREPGIHTPDRAYGFRVRAEPVIGPRVARTRWHAPE